jgi:hypothetical protein
MNVIRMAAKRALWETGFYALSAKTRPWQGVAVLGYHGLRNATATTPGTSEELHVRVGVFESQLRAIRRLATPISLTDWRLARAGSAVRPAAAGEIRGASGRVRLYRAVGVWDATVVRRTRAQRPRG